MDIDDRRAEPAPTRTEPALPPDAFAALERSLSTGGGSARSPRSIARRLGSLTSVLVLALFAAVGFIGGVQVQKHQGTTTAVATGGFGGGAAARAAAAGTSTTAAGGPSTTGGAGGGAAPGAGGAGAGGRAAGGQGPAGTGTGAGAAAAGGAPAGGGAAGRAAGAATAGQVKLIDGNNIYVTDASGNVVKVVTTPSSRFTKTGSGSIQDVRPGDTVVVQGQKGDDGIVTATAVANSGNAATP
jgi:hypothetical protein